MAIDLYAAFVNAAIAAGGGGLTIWLTSYFKGKSENKKLDADGEKTLLQETREHLKLAYDTLEDTNEDLNAIKREYFDLLRQEQINQGKIADFERMLKMEIDSYESRLATKDDMICKLEGEIQKINARLSAVRRARNALRDRYVALGGQIVAEDLEEFSDMEDDDD